MKSDSIFVATFMKGESNYSGETWAYPECITYTLEYMTQIINESGLQCHPVEWYHRNQSLMLVTLPECQLNLPRIFPDSEKVESLLDDLAYYKNAFLQLESKPHQK